MSKLRQKRGRDGEHLAVAFLQFKGAEIITCNWRPNGLGLRGEIDIIARDGEFWCFVEVKARSSDALGEPQEAVNATKQKQIGRLASAFLSQQNLHDVPARLDIVEVWLEPEQKPRLAWLKNAFEYRN